MKKILLSIFILCSTLQLSVAQKYYSKIGNISFYSHTPIEEIKAESNSASTVFDLATGKIQWAVLIKSFEFEKALMQEHFNENYMESGKYPKASFKGAITDIEKLTLKEGAEIDLEIVGTMTIHGVEKQVETIGTFTVLDSGINARSTLKVSIADYDIEVPSVVSKNIAEEIEITINAEYVLLDQ